MSEKPKARRGMVCHWCRWDREGRVAEARYRPVEKATPAADPETAHLTRGALAVERQGSLL